MNTGYIFNSEHGAFSPDGKVSETMPQADIDRHNRELAKAELDAMSKTGKAVLYLRAENPKGAYSVGTWEGSFRFPVCQYRASRNNWNAPRMDVWFVVGVERWHGVNIGDNEIVRCKRTKEKAR